MYYSTKTYTHATGLSCAFRQWRADSHCRYLHGYALEVKLVFRAEKLDKTNWVMDFGGLKEIKTWLEDIFDHKTLVANDDPEFDKFQELYTRGIIDMRVVWGTGCEAFAKIISDYTTHWLDNRGITPRVQLSSVEVREHAGNSAVYFPDHDDA